MVQRDITQFRSVTNVTPDLSEAISLGGVAKMGADIIEANQQALMNENFSKAQLELNAVNMEIKEKYKSDPFKGIEELKTRRQEILNGYGEQISPFFRKSWQDNARELSTNEDVQLQTWAYTQAKKNTVTSINNSIKNNLSQAAQDGIAYGQSETTELSSLLNFGLSKKKLAAFGDKHIGADETTHLLEGYDDNYLKSFLSGVSEANPLKALRLMDDQGVINSFRDKRQYMKMKDAIENRALQINKINAENQVLTTLKDENNVLTQSLSKPMSYADLQVAFEKSNMSPEAQSFFMKANGYAARDKTLSKSDQLKEKGDIYADLTQLTNKEEIGSEDLQRFQQRVYGAMDRGALSEKEGLEYLNQIASPFIAKQEESLKAFGEKNWVRDSIGFQGIQEMFNKDLAITPAEGEDEVGALTQNVNDRNRVKLYDFYMTSLQETAGQYGIKIGEIQNLNSVQRQKLFTEAQAAAKRAYMIDENPSLATLPDMPNQVLSNGRLIQGAAGNRDIRPDFSTKGNFVILEKNGHRARRYEDGTIEVLN